MDIIKVFVEFLVIVIMVQMLMMLFECVFKLFIDFFFRKMLCVLSNVFGFQYILYLGGQKIIQGIFWVFMRVNIGVGLFIFSYNGEICVGVYVDECVFLKFREVVQEFEKNFCKLVNELNINENDEL